MFRLKPAASGGEDFKLGVQRLREENNDVLIDSIMRMIVMVLVGLGLLAIGDMQIHRDHLVELYVHKSLLLVVGIGAGLGLNVRTTRSWPRFFGVLFFAATALSCGVQGAITGDVVTPAPLLMTLALGTACLLPWGLVPQAVLVVACVLAVVVNGYLVTGTLAGAASVPFFRAALWAFAATVYLAHFLERQRLAWRAQGLRLAEAARDGDGRFGVVNEGLWDWSIETGRVFYSTRCKEILGTTADMVGSHLDEWRHRIHPDDAPAFEAELLACIDGERELFEHEHRLLRPDGSACWVMARGKTSRNESGAVIRIAGSLTDISKRKRIEAALNESERKYRDMIENLTDVVFALDTEGRYT